MEALHLEDSSPGISDRDFIIIISDCFRKLGIEMPIARLQQLSHGEIMEYVEWIEEKAKLTDNYVVIEMLNFAGVIC